MNYLIYNNLAGEVKETKEETLNILKGNFENLIALDAKDTDYNKLNESLNEDDNVILMGGDGTVNFFANFAVSTTVKGNWYIYSAGTGNDFLNDLETKNLTTLLNPYVKNLPYVEANGEKKYFVNNVGFGVDGMVCEVADERKAKGKSINYAKITIGLLLRKFKRRNVKIRVDGEEYSFNNAWIAPTMNGRYYGGGMICAPNQDRNSDKFTLVVLYSKSRLGALMKFTKIFKGEHVKYKKNVFVKECNDVEVEFDKPCALQYDGEVIKNVLKYKAHKEKKMD